MSKQEHVRVTATTSAPAAVVYGLLADGTTWPAWSALDECDPEGVGPDGREQVGTVRASRRGRTPGWDKVTELVPDEKFGYEHVRGLPVRDYQGSVRLTETERGTTIVWEARFHPTWPGTGGLLHRGITKFLGECCDGLAAYAEKV